MQEITFVSCNIFIFIFSQLLRGCCISKKPIFSSNRDIFLYGKIIPMHIILTHTTCRDYKHGYVVGCVVGWLTGINFFLSVTFTVGSNVFCVCGQIGFKLTSIMPPM